MNNPIYVDVDGTLVRDLKADDNDKYSGVVLKGVEIPHPLRGNELVYKVPMHNNIQLLKDMSTRGRTIVVWSAAGWQWAQAVVHALNLENFVNYAGEKGIAYMDDLDCSEFMGQRIFLND
ncbi:MAG: hypothetical protein ACAH17_03635 [Candidatus Paceibacterota bacterium]